MVTFSAVSARPSEFLATEVPGRPGTRCRQSLGGERRAPGGRLVRCWTAMQIRAATHISPPSAASRSRAAWQSRSPEGACSAADRGVATSSRGPALEEGGGASGPGDASSAGGGGTLGGGYPASAQGVSLSFRGSHTARGRVAWAFRDSALDRPGGVCALGNRDPDRGGVTSERGGAILVWGCVALTFRDSASGRGGPSR